MIRSGILGGFFYILSGLIPAALADDGAVDLSMNCFDESKQEWRRYEKIGEGIRSVNADVPGEPEPIHESDDANLRYIVQFKTYSGMIDIVYDFDELTVVKNLASGPQTLSCE